MQLSSIYWLYNYCSGIYRRGFRTSVACGTGQSEKPSRWCLNGLFCWGKWLVFKNMRYSFVRKTYICSIQSFWIIVRELLRHVAYGTIFRFRRSIILLWFFVRKWELTQQIQPKTCVLNGIGHFHSHQGSWKI